MDMLALFIRYAWFIAILLPTIFSPITALKLLLLITLFYITLEYIQLTAAAMLTPTVKEPEWIVIAPLTIPYRELYAS